MPPDDFVRLGRTDAKLVVTEIKRLGRRHKLDTEYTVSVVEDLEVLDR